MRIPILLRGALVALIALFGVSLQSANADSGSITLTIYKGGWIIGGSAGGGTLTFRGRSYRLGVGGIDYGLVFGGSKTVLHGSVRNIQRASDVAGVYAAAGAGLAVGARCPRDRAHQPEWRRSGALRPADRADGERRPERVGDHDELIRKNSATSIRSRPEAGSSPAWPQSLRVAWLTRDPLVLYRAFWRRLRPVPVFGRPLCQPW